MRRAHALRWGAAAALLLAVAVALTQREHVSTVTLERLLSELGWWAPPAFILLYAVAAVLFLPGWVFTVAGGALFGPWLGTLYSLVGATAGALAAFLIARYLASDWVRAKAGPRLGRLIEGIDNEGWRFVAFTRLVPVFPFNLLNYAFGLTGIRTGAYVLTSFICMLPGAAAYAYLGFVGREAATGGGDLVRRGLLALGLLAAIALLPPLVRRWRSRRAP